MDLIGLRTDHPKAFQKFKDKKEYQRLIQQGKIHGNHEVTTANK